MNMTTTWTIYGALAGAGSFFALIMLPFVWLNRFRPVYAAERDLGNTKMVTLFALLSALIGSFIGGALGHNLAPLSSGERVWELFDCVVGVSVYLAVTLLIKKVWPEPKDRKKEKFILTLLRELIPLSSFIIYYNWLRHFLH